MSTRFILKTILLLLVLACVGCPRARPAPVEVEQVSSLGFAQYVPATTAALVGFRPVELRALVEEVFGVDLFDMPGPPVLRDVLGSEPLEGRDADALHHLAVTSAGNAELLRHLRAGAPLSNGQDLFDSNIHARLIVPATDPELLSATLLTRCRARTESAQCEEFIDLTHGPGFVIVDSHIEQRVGQKALELQERTRAELASTAAMIPWARAAQRAFTAPEWLERDDAVFGVYVRVDTLFDLLAITNALASGLGLQHAPDEQRLALQDQIIYDNGRFLQVDSPEVAELADMALVFRRAEDVIVVDGVAGLTTYGLSVEEAGGRGVSLQERTLDQATAQQLVDLRWAYDLNAAFAATNPPLWATNIDDLPREMFLRELEQHLMEIGRGSRLAVLQYPVTMMQIRSQLEHPWKERTPELDDVKGAWVQAWLRPEAIDISGVAAALSLALRPGSAFGVNLRLDGDFLGQEGLGVFTRKLEFEDRDEFQASINLEPDDVFLGEVRAIEPGLLLFMNLAQLIDLLGDESPQVSSFVERFPFLHHSSGVQNEQWLVRLQLGQEPAHRPTPLPDAQRAEHPLQPLGAQGLRCAFLATHYSLQAMGAMPRSTDDGKLAVATLAFRMLDDLVGECADEPDVVPEIQWTLEQWRLRHGPTRR